MVRSLCHETFYVSGTLADEELGLYVGWVGRKGSSADHMPLSNQKGDITLVFSGEEFPGAGTKARLKQQGHTFEPEGLPHLVHLSGEDPAFPASLNGRFH